MFSMRKTRKISLGQRLLLVLLSGVAVGLWVGATADVKPVPARERTVAFTYATIVKAIPMGARHVELWLPVPHDSPFQRITNVVIDSPYAYQFDTGQYGNRVLHITLPASRTDSVTVVMRFTARRREHIQTRLQAANNQKVTDAADPNMARWLRADRLVPIDGQIRKWATDVVNKAGAKTESQKARAIYDHVIATVKYDKTGTGWGRGDIYYACDARRGNCTDFHAVFIGYCRAVGIPARFAIGFSLPTDRPAGQVSGYHCWAEFYLNGVGWVPIDASEAAKNPARRNYFFGAHDENRVEFSVGRDLTLYPGQTEPINYFIYPYVEVEGKPFAGLVNRFSYQDLETNTRR